jgi:hypothetical protein
MSLTINVQSAVKSVLDERINEKIDDYPSALKPADIMEIMNTSQARTYEALNRGDIPGAKKIKGFGWRIPKETFFVWWYGNNVNEKKPFKKVRRVK